MNLKVYRSYTNNNQETVFASISANEKPFDGDEETKKDTSTRSNAYIQNKSTSLVDASIALISSANLKSLSSSLLLAMFDFGGQSVFNIIHHLFLTSYGVYVVVFNMLNITNGNNREH